MTYPEPTPVNAKCNTIHLNLLNSHYPFKSFELPLKCCRNLTEEVAPKLAVMSTVSKEVSFFMEKSAPIQRLMGKNEYILAGPGSFLWGLSKMH